MHYLRNKDEIGGIAGKVAWIDADGISTRYFAAGPENAPALLFLHGTGGHFEAFSRNFDAAARDHRVLALDLVGHGWSDLADHPLEIDDYVDHVLAFLDALGVERVAISGVSLGGWVAARLAIDHPERVTALILNTPGGSRADGKVMATIRAKTSHAVDAVSPESVRARLEFLVSDPDRITDEMVACRYAIYSREGMAENMERVLVLQDPEVRERNLLDPEDFARIEAPTLVVWTTRDPTGPPAEGERIAAMIPGASYVLLEDCGHWPQFEKPEIFNRLQAEFLEHGAVEQPAASEPLR